MRSVPVTLSPAAARPDSAPVTAPAIPPNTASAQAAAPARALIGFGEVRHTRLRPQRNAFAYRTFFLMLPMRALRTHGDGALARNRASLLSFHDADHGDGRSADAGGSLAWLEGLLAQEGIEDADGEIWLHCYPRVLGYTFKPVSFWYCHRADGSLRAIVVEVNNTFGERHCYLLDAPGWGRELQANKVFHVSPFCPVEGSYRFRFFTPPERRRKVVRIDYDTPDGPLLQTSVSGHLRPLDSAAVRHALLRYPAMTLGVMARIHWQALRLWWLRTPFFRKPAPPVQPMTRQLRGSPMPNTTTPSVPHQA